MYTIKLKSHNNLYFTSHSQREPLFNVDSEDCFHSIEDLMNAAVFLQNNGEQIALYEVRFEDYHNFLMLGEEIFNPIFP